MLKKNINEAWLNKKIKHYMMAGDKETAHRFLETYHSHIPGYDYDKGLKLVNKRMKPKKDVKHENKKGDD